jgi:hypothetical protein
VKPGVQPQAVGLPWDAHFAEARVVIVGLRSVFDRFWDFSFFPPIVSDRAACIHERNRFKQLDGPQWVTNFQAAMDLNTFLS